LHVWCKESSSSSNKAVKQLVLRVLYLERFRKTGSKVKDAVVKGSKTGLPVPAKRRATGAAADAWTLSS
jgi:hypothetical protein